MSGQSNPSAAAFEAERVVLVLKKNQDAMEAQAQAMVQLIQDANVGTQFSARA